MGKKNPLTKGLDEHVDYHSSGDYKSAKKAWKKTRRHARRPWRPLAIWTGIFGGIFLIAGVCCYYVGNTLAIALGLDFQTVVNGDDTVEYYSREYSDDEIQEKGAEICRQLEAEGASLLKNDNNALPLSQGAKVSCFSSSSVDLVYGGTGSGNVDTSTAPTLKDGLERAGLTVNETLWDFYETGPGSSYRRTSSTFTSMMGIGGGATLSEVPWSEYTNDVLSSVSGSEAAIVTFSRIGGEGIDADYDPENGVNYLELNETELELLENVASLKDSGDVDKIIVLVNSANALEVDFLFEDRYDIDACLWIGDPGANGIESVGKILSGDINPSGSLADTYCKDNTTSPAMTYYTSTSYEGTGEGVSDAASKYFIYQEGIYVGYKYYETRYEDYVMGTGNAGNYSYSDDVAYSFGYGLSYTTFEYSDMSLSYDSSSDKYTVSVTVTNTGDVPGKEPVQIYVQSPYTGYDVMHEVEKASASLVGFGKTDTLASGASQTLEIEVDRRDIASYDSEGAGTYILDEGTYYLTAATDAHNAVNNFLTAKGYSPENTSGRMDADGDSDLVKSFDVAEFDSTTYSTSKNGTKIENQFEDTDPSYYEGQNAVTWLTRNNWEDTFPKEVHQLHYTDELVEDLQDTQYDAADYETCEMPTLGAESNHKLIEMMGKDYDDPAWESLLDQLTFDEMAKVIGDGFHWSMPVTSVDAPQSRDENGPQGVTASLFGSDSIEGTCYTSEDVMAATFNTDLMYEMGRVLGDECLASGVHILYGPGNNTHRTPYGGRNFEYYSEDGFLAGKICAPEVRGMDEKGIKVVAKHFALNDCETDRGGVCVWANEQSIREIYLKAFQEPLEENPTSGVMAAYTRFGATWSGGNYNLITNVLRGEWGVNGLCITDNAIYSVVSTVDAVMAGTSILDAMFTFEGTLDKYENDPVVVTAMREAMHHNLYGIVNSSAMNGITAETEITYTEPTIYKVIWIVSIILLIAFIVTLVIRIVVGIRFRKQHPKPKKKNYKKS